MNEHTPEPWRVNQYLGIEAVQDLWRFNIAETLTTPAYETQVANARRIVACVNACKDWPTETLEAWAADPSSPLLTNQLAIAHAELTALRAQRDELVSALRPFADLLPMVERLNVRRDSSPIWTLADATITQGDVRRAASALAKLTEEVRA